MSKPGTVFLVGAGPGDPGLLTQRAVELMQHCDVVCYDLLVSDAILSHIPHGTTMIPVGYRGYCGTSIEYGMHPDVVEQALLGKQVLRLKAGDPFIFGRANEECQCLQHHGIDYQVVPGITASLGAAAYAGFPLTSNGMASDVTFASGHRASTTVSNWAALGQASGTLVLYMGAKKLTQHAEALISQGKAPDTPLAVISAATSARHRLLITTLAEAGPQIAGFDNGDPMLVVIGEVVTLADTLDWRGLLPLAGVQVIAAGDNQALDEPLKLAGAIVARPFGAARPMTLSDEAMTALRQHAALHLADVEAAQALWQGAMAQRLDVRRWPWRLSASPQAAEWLAGKGIICQLEPAPEAKVVTQADPALVASSALQPPGFPLRPTTVALVDDLDALDYLLAEQVLDSDATVLTTSAALLAAMSDRGVNAVVIEDAPALGDWLATRTQAAQAA